MPASPVVEKGSDPYLNNFLSERTTASGGYYRPLTVIKRALRNHISMSGEKNSLLIHGSPDLTAILMASYDCLKQGRSIRIGNGIYQWISVYNIARQMYNYSDANKTSEFVWRLALKNQGHFQFKELGDRQFIRPYYLFSFETRLG